jgi:N6-L-threonylcarbamoyladenine synthase
MNILGTTLDDAIGEAFDKCGKRMGLPYPSGPLIDKLAEKGNPHKFIFPISKLSNYNVSYSGVKTAFINFISNSEQKNPDFIKNNLVDLCASLQYTLVRIILNKIELVARDKSLTEIVIGGGVAANTEIRKQLQDMVMKEDWKLSLPPLEYTTDNAAMIGITAYYKILKKEYGSLKDSSNARLKFN